MKRSIHIWTAETAQSSGAVIRFIRIYIR